MSEREWERQVLQLAGMYGWLGYHTHDSRRSAKGFPDWVFVRERVLYVELKGDGGRLKLDQMKWVTALRKAGQEVYVWFPGALGEVQRILAR